MIIGYSQVILKNRLVKNVLVMVSGTAGAQIIAFLLMPFITRYYGPETYGIYGTFIASIGIMGTFTALSYPIAIVLPSSDSIARKLMQLSIIIASTISGITLIILLIFGDSILNRIGISEIIPYKLFLPLMMFLTAYQAIAQQWLIRKEKFKGIANISVLHSVVNFGGQAAMGLYAPLSVTLIAIHSIAISLRSTLMLYIGIENKRSTVKDSTKLIEVAKKYKDFPVFRTPQTLLDAISQGLPVLMLTSLFGPSVAGFYALTKMALSAPGQVIAESVQSVFYPHFNKANLNENPVLKLLIKSIGWLAIISILPFTTIIIFGPTIFSYVFGNEWYEAGVYARWVAISTFFSVISRPAISAISVFNLQAWFLKFEIFSLIVRVSALLLGFRYFKSALFAIALYSCATALLNLIISIKTLYYSKQLDYGRI